MHPRLHAQTIAVLQDGELPETEAVPLLAQLQNCCRPWNQECPCAPVGCLVLVAACLGALVLADGHGADAHSLGETALAETGRPTRGLETLTDHPPPPLAAEWFTY